MKTAQTTGSIGLDKTSASCTFIQCSLADPLCLIYPHQRHDLINIHMNFVQIHMSFVLIFLYAAGIIVWREQGENKTDQDTGLLVFSKNTVR